MKTMTNATTATATTPALPKLTVDYLAARYGDVLVHGALGTTYAGAHRLARRLARHTGNDVEDVRSAVADRLGDLRRARGDDGGGGDDDGPAH